MPLHATAISKACTQQGHVQRGHASSLESRIRCREQPEDPLLFFCAGSSLKSRFRRQKVFPLGSVSCLQDVGTAHCVAGSSLKSPFRRQKVYLLPAPPRQVALPASLGPPCPLRLLTLFPIVCVCVWHRVTLCAQGWAEEFILMVCPFKNHCLFKTANCHAGNSSASRPMKTQCFLLTVHWCTCGGVSYTLFLWDISRRNFHWVPSRQIHVAFHTCQIPKAFEHSDTAAGLSRGGISIFRKFLRKMAEEFRSQTIAWHTETTSGENERHKGAVFSQCP